MEGSLAPWYLRASERDYERAAKGQASIPQADGNDGSERHLGPSYRLPAGGPQIERPWKLEGTVQEAGETAKPMLEERLGMYPPIPTGVEWAKEMSKEADSVEVGCHTCISDAKKLASLLRKAEKQYLAQEIPTNDHTMFVADFLLHNGVHFAEIL